LLSGTMPKMVFRGNFDRVSFALKLARKDLGLATEVGRELNVPMPIASLVEQDFLSAIANGLADKDSTAAFTVQEDRANVKVRVPKS
jgi:3-hydroxyisobutyrate dehydrogenase-like beta-hydroxyacid dehydrogenase